MSEQEERERYNAERAAEDYEHDRQRAIDLAALERAVIDAAVAEAVWRRQVDLQRPDIIDCTLRGLQIAEQELLAAVDALLAARRKP